jgi:hypothetical protein
MIPDLSPWVERGAIALKLMSLICTLIEGKFQYEGCSFLTGFLHPDIASMRLDNAVSGAQT